MMMDCAHLRGDVKVIHFTVSHVVRADWFFTMPAVIIQLFTGVGLVHFGGHSLTDDWILAALLLFIFAGACWLPVVWIQIKMKNLVDTAIQLGEPLPPFYWSLNRWWMGLGALGFPAVVVIFYLMVFKRL